MLSKNIIKFIQSLESKKNRESAGLFVIEGDKMVAEIFSSNHKIHLLAATKEWFDENKNLNLEKCPDRHEITAQELSKASFLKTPQNALCLVHIPQYTFNLDEFSNELSLILDTVQDPGNLGTIIRIADWFGITHIICSPNSVDQYNPKVVQATMGAISRVRVYYQNLDKILPDIQQRTIPVFGTILNGENIYQCDLPKHGFIMMGNESKGINPNYHKYFTKGLLIPSFPADEKRSESLNVSVATAIVCSEFRRRATN